MVAAKKSVSVNLVRAISDHVAVQDGGVWVLLHLCPAVLAAECLARECHAAANF